MRILLYINKSDKKYVNKNIQQINTLTGTMKESTSICDPTIMLNLNGINFNYIFIEEFNRFYYVKDVRNIRNDLWEIDCHVDVLMTFSGQYLNNKAIISKSEDDFNYEPDYESDYYPSKLNTFIETTQFASGFNEQPEFILLTAGAVADA